MNYEQLRRCWCYLKTPKAMKNIISYIGFTNLNLDNPLPIRERIPLSYTSAQIPAFMGQKLCYSEQVNSIQPIINLN